MDKRLWNAPGDAEFDRLLAASLPDPPPDEVARAVTPWRRVMEQLVWGLALTGITLQVGGLQYWLPALGTLLCLLAFRTLRRENPWLRAGWALSAVRTGAVWGILILNAFLWRQTPAGQVVMAVLTGAGQLAQLGQLVCLWQGLDQVRRAAGRAQDTGAGWLVVWYAGLYALALVRYNGLLIPLAMIGAYLLILYRLYRLSREMETTGYGLHPAPARLSDRMLMVLLAVALVLGLAAGYGFGGRIPMDWQPAQPSTDPQAAAVRQELAAMGFPETVLADLTDQEVLACRGAKRVVVSERDLPLTDFGIQGRQGTLRSTGVAVELPGEREQWKLFQHFQWTQTALWWGTECIQLWPVYDLLPEGWAEAEPVTGRLLCEQNGQTMTAPYAYLGEQSYTATSVFWGEEQRRDVFASFSLPRNAENRRGYLTYTVQEVNDGWIVDSWMNYVHQTRAFQYPVCSALEACQTGNTGLNSAFALVQDALQFYPNDDPAVPFGQE